MAAPPTGLAALHPAASWHRLRATDQIAGPSTRAERTSVMSGINEFIGNEVKSNNVVPFMKGTPGFPQCGFSGQVVQILDHLGVDYKGVNILTSDALRQGIKEYS